ncbi:MULTISPECIES: YraN family protein [unclassified Caballeronia]|jgi:putative endonuclease|uniref:YraN family protein n=1 Tax=unclassified Caballeronia TaxID=2646786 RepID=UPI002028A526|nr:MULTISPECIES: YraN family protein [unclassified Caballeronia]
MSAGVEGKVVILPCAIRWPADNFYGGAVSKTLGDAFESHALAFLQRQRMRLVARNVTCRGGEIDLVMLDERGALVFVEVRARRSRRYANAVASVDAKKRARLVHAAQHFLTTWRGALPACRFDVVAFDAGRIHWLPDAFRADEA